MVGPRRVVGGSGGYLVAGFGAPGRNRVSGRCRASIGESPVEGRGCSRHVEEWDGAEGCVDLGGKGGFYNWAPALNNASIRAASAGLSHGNKDGK